MRIGVDGRLWSETGVGRYIRNLTTNIERLDEKNDYFLLVKKDESENVGKFFSKSNWKIIPTDIKWHTLSEQLRFSSVLNALDLDIMHFTYFSLPLLYSRPFIITIHDLIIHHFPTGRASTLPSPLYVLKRLAYLYLIQKAADKAEAIIAVSNSTKREIVDHLTVSQNKVKVIYEGVDKKIIGNNGKKIHDFPYILYVGNAYPHKNLNRAIAAFEIAKKKNEKFVLVGKEDFFYKRLRKEIDNKGTKDVIFFGEATDGQLSNLYYHSKAYITASLMEGFGLPPLEAMANGCFVIASNIPSIREVCQDAALYFNPYDISDIADKIGIAFSQADKESFISKGKERVREFSWKKMAKETLKIYESSIGLRQGK